MTQQGPIEAVIFDMDGLMLDTERIALRALADAAASLGYPWREEIGFAMVGLNSRDSDAILLRHLGPDHAIAPLRKAFNEYYLSALAAGPIPLMPGLMELLDFLEGAGIAKAVATSTRSQQARYKLDKAGIGGRFPTLVGGDQVQHGKPAPDIFLAAAARLNTPPQACLVLEDSAPGVAAALAAGMRVIMVPDVIAPSPDVVALGHVILPSLHDVRAYLAREISDSEPAINPRARQA